MAAAQWYQVHAGELIGPGLLLKILRDTELDKNDLKK
jgi:predicted RNA binding protein YcfA (HicA-like mRNA interferase family)